MVRHARFAATICATISALGALSASAQYATITSPLATTGNLFGATIVALPDINSDAAVDLAISAPFESGGGKVHLLSGSDRTLIRTVNAPDGVSGGFFGLSVIPWRQMTGGAVPEFLASAPWTTHATLAGAGRIYVINPQTGVSFQSEGSPSPESDGSYGYNLVSLPDLNSDTVADVAVSAPGENGGRGRVYVMNGATLSSAIRTLSSPNAEANGQFGQIVLSVPDADGDTLDDLLITAPDETVGGFAKAGRVYLMSSADGSLIHSFESASPETDARLSGVARLGDIDGGGKDDYALFSNASLPGILVDGTVLIYSAESRTLLSSLGSPSPNVGLIFGNGVSETPDLDNDGVRDIAIGYITGFDDSARFYSGATREYIGRIAEPFSSFGLFGPPTLLPDLGADGNEDLAVRSFASNSTGTVYLYSMQPDGSAAASRDLGIAAIGGSSQRSITITNGGFSGLTITGVAFSGPEAGRFAVEGATPTVVGPSSTGDIVVRFSPTTDGLGSATMQVTTNDPDTPVISVALTGTGFTALSEGIDGYAYISRNGSVYEINMSNGNRRVINGSNDAPFSDPNIYVSGGILVEDGSNVLVGQATYHLVVRINRHTLRRTAVTDPFNSVGSGPSIGGLNGMVMDGTGNIYGCSHTGAISTTNIATGARSILSQSSGGPPIGSGPSFSGSLENIVRGPSGKVIVIAGLGVPNIYQVDTVTGDRSLFPGTAPLGLSDMALLPGGDYLAGTQGASVYTIDDTTGTATVLSGYDGSSIIGRGLPLAFATAVAVGSVSGQYFVLDSSRGALLRVDSTTGDRTIVSSWNAAAPRGTGPTVGAGPAFGSERIYLAVLDGINTSDAEGWDLYQ